MSGSEDVTIPRQLDRRWRPFNQSETAAIAKILDNPCLIHWYAENLDRDDDPRISPMPTGLVYPNGRPPALLPVPPIVPLKQRTLNVLCAHRVRESSQWSTRQRVTEIAKTDWAAWTTVVESEVDEQKFAALLGEHSFVLCVEGGGLDPSPKAWQAILYGAIPIVRRTALESAYRDLPVAMVPNWMAEQITIEKLAAWRDKYSHAHDIPARRRETIRRLTADYWWNKIEAQLGVKLSLA